MFVYDMVHNLLGISYKIELKLQDFFRARV